MATTEKTISALVGRQLPDFVRADHPKFQLFIEKYYKWLEQDGTFTSGANTYNYGNTVYHIQNIEKYRDIDETRDEFVRYFKQELLPYFPENTSLDLVKILKGAREFYVKKGSEESLKWLFRVLFNQDIEIFYPKKQILIASDGKWKRPQAFQLNLSEENQDLDVNLLEKRKGTGSESKATCVIESANMTVDRIFGYEILEIYVSNVDKEFQNGEQLEIPYTDTNGISHVFSEKIIGSISGIVLDSNIKTDPNQNRRGLLYNVGDPVVVYGGLDTTAQANDAVAYVGNVSVGSVEGVTPLFLGYGYRTYSNTEVVVYRNEADDPNANSSVDIRVSLVNSAVNATQSNFNFKETISLDRMPVEYLTGVVLNAADYAVFTQNNRNIILNATEADSTDIYNNLEAVWANGTSYATANFKGYILTSNASGFCQGGAAYTGALALYAVSNTQSLATTGFLVGQLLYSANTDKSFTVNSVTTAQLPANISSTLQQTLNFEEIETGGVAIFDVLNGGYGFTAPPPIEVSSYFDTYISDNYDYVTEYADKKLWRQPIGAMGQVAHVYINNGGTGYANGELVQISGRGYNFSGYVNVASAATGTINRVTITNRGEGYYGPKTVSISTTSGSNATLTAYTFGEGETHTVVTGAIGRIRDIRIVSRGYDYVSAPVVSLKVVDMIIQNINEGDEFVEGEKVYQGNSLETATFAGNVKRFDRANNALRLFNYSGSVDTTLPFTTTEEGFQFYIDTAARVAAPAQYPAAIIAAGLPNPWFYGNGKARALAQFYNGLIKFPGFYLNTDGFVSADKKLQDERVYHNYSYVIQSEKSLADYRNSVKDIAHPIGMTMLAETVSLSQLDENIQTETAVYINAPNPVDATVSIADSYGNTVTGTNTDFENPIYAANVGDIIVITDSNNPLRSQAKLITDVASDTELTVEGDFTYIGQGKLSANNGDTTVKVSGNTNVIAQFLQAGDQLKFNIATGNLYVAQTGTVQVFTSNGKVVGSGTQFATELSVNAFVKINNQIKQVVNIASATVMNVNSVFSACTSGIAINKLATTTIANVTSITGNVVSVDVTISLTDNVSGLVYVVAPDYTDDYGFDIITVTDD